LRLKRTDWIFILVAAAVIGALVLLSLMGREKKPVSAIPQHVGITADTPRADCLVCHDPSVEGSVAPLAPTHPHVWKKEQVACTTCHTVPPGRIEKVPVP